MNPTPRVRPTESTASGSTGISPSAASSGIYAPTTAPRTSESWPHGDHRTVAALFTDRASAEQAIDELKASSAYIPSEIGVAMRDRNLQGELVRETGTHAAEGAVSGAVGGGLLGGVAGWLVAIGALAIPGVGPVVAGGALATALGITAGTTIAGAGIGAAAGGIVGALVGLGIPEEDAKYFEEGFREGGVIVTVRARDTNRAAEILRRHGGGVRPVDETLASRGV